SSPPITASAKKARRPARVSRGCASIWASNPRRACCARDRSLTPSRVRLVVIARRSSGPSRRLGEAAPRSPCLSAAYRVVQRPSTAYAADAYAADGHTEQGVWCRLETGDASCGRDRLGRVCRTDVRTGLRAVRHVSAGRGCTPSAALPPEREG